jgi:hypothetical protein
MSEWGLTGYQLFDILANNPNAPVRVDYGLVTIPVVAAQYRNGQILLTGGSLWLPPGWTLEEPKHQGDDGGPQHEPGEP